MGLHRLDRGGWIMGYRVVGIILIITALMTLHVSCSAAVHSKAAEQIGTASGPTGTALVVLAPGPFGRHSPIPIAAP